jgi:ribosomal protein S18 acetylase RimI-like enzyme
MAVLPSAHGSGIAGQLLARAEEHLRQAGAQLVTLDTTAPLQRAIRFYEKHGYRASGKISDFFGMPLYEYMKRL